MQTKENWAIDDRYARPEEWQNLKKSLPNSCQMPDAHKEGAVPAQDEGIGAGIGRAANTDG